MPREATLGEREVAAHRVQEAVLEAELVQKLAAQDVGGESRISHDNHLAMAGSNVRIHLAKYKQDGEAGTEAYAAGEVRRWAEAKGR